MIFFLITSDSIYLLNCNDKDMDNLVTKKFRRDTRYNVESTLFKIGNHNSEQTHL